MQKLFKCAKIEFLSLSKYKSNDQNNEIQEVTEKILSMMEKFTQRIVKLENMMNK